MNVLVVEDNPADRFLLEKAFSSLPDLDCRLHFVEDGCKALDFLSRRLPYENMPAVDLVLLDLNLPRKNGQETLAEVKTDPELKKIPVIVLTGSGPGRDLDNCYASGASFCLIKPASYRQYADLIRSLFDFLSHKVVFPSERSRAPLREDA